MTTTITMMIIIIIIIIIIIPEVKVKMFLSTSSRHIGEVEV